MQGMQEFDAKTIAVLRAERPRVDRFARCDQVIAYAGLDVTEKREWEVAWTTQALQTSGGRLRRILYVAAVRCARLENAPLGAYFQHLVARGMKRRVALMAAMHKMLAVASYLFKTHEPFDPSKVGLAGAV
jgi:transposase